MANKRTNTIAAANSFSDPLTLKKGGILTLTGTWTATVSLQRYDVGSAAWVDVTSNTGTPVTIASTGTGLPLTISVSPFDTSADYRWGVKAGNYTSGSIVGTLQGR